ncbi:MAG: twin-arginine translocase TatA/TatE family subunit [Bacteroidia bacterium]
MISLVILFLGNLGGGELLIVMLFILLFFGSKNIPNLARGLGKGMREFRNAMNDVRSDLEISISADRNEKKEVKPQNNQDESKTADDAS